MMMVIHIFNILQDVDLYTVTVEDLAWQSEFTLVARRNDYVQALVTFFTVEFSKCHKRTGFSTGPDAHYTHWKQTVFYLEDSLTCKKNEEIKGSFAVVPNKRNNVSYGLLCLVSIIRLFSEISTSRYR
jgi:protein arginine N-methyltransferase 1